MSVYIQSQDEGRQKTTLGHITPTTNYKPNPLTLIPKPQKPGEAKDVSADVGFQSAVGLECSGRTFPPPGRSWMRLWVLKALKHQKLGFRFRVP